MAWKSQKFLFDMSEVWGVYKKRFKYLLKFESVVISASPLSGVCKGGRQGRKELMFFLQPNHILFAHSNGMSYPEEEARVI